VGPCGYTQGTGTINTGGSPMSITGLSPNTCYDVYVRRACGVDGNSTWTGPYTIYTECAVSQKLAGTYTLDKNLPASATNFTSFADVVSVLNACGVAGPVVINVSDDVYTEQITFQDIVDVSATNTVTFQSDPTNTGMPELT